MQRHVIILLFFIGLLYTESMHAQSYYALDFTENKGQWKEDFSYKTTIGNGTVFIRSNGITVLKNHPDDQASFLEYTHAHGEVSQNGLNRGDQMGNTPGENIVIRSHAYTMNFLGTDASSQFVSEKPTGEVANYFIGDDKKTWKTDVKSYGAVLQKDLYAGIDVRYYSNGDKLKYDLIVHAGSSPSKIVMKYEGVDKLSMKEGQLIIKTSVGDAKELIPYAYQVINGLKKEVKCSYDLLGDQVRFKLIGYDSRADLVIDPVLVFSTYTGSKSSNWGYTAAPGPDGSLYAGGIVFATGYPITLGAFQATFNGGTGIGTIRGIDIGLTRFSPDGKSRIFSTYLGGSGDEFPHSIYVDPQGNAVILGRTTSSNFPVVNGNKVGVLGNTDIFVTKLSADGKSLIGSVVVGGSGVDGANIDPSISPTGKSLLYNYGDNARSEVILDKSNNIYIASCTQSKDFPKRNTTTNYGSLQDGVVMKFSPDLSTIYYSAIIGGNDDDGAFVLSLNPLTNDLYVGGATKSTDLQGNKTGVISGSLLGGIDGFVTVLNNAGVLQKSTYLGTSQTDIVYGVQFDQKGFPYIMGISLGSWPVKNASFSNAGSKQFIAKLKPDLSDFVYSTVYGTAALVPNISPVAFLVDRCENVYVSGWGGRLNLCMTGSFDQKTVGTTGLPIVGGPIQNYTDNKDFYFFVLQKDAAAQLYGSFFGQQGGEGDHVDGGTSRFDSKGAIYQAVCSNCGGSNICSRDPIRRAMIITPGVVAPVNAALGSGTAGECNLAAFKINFEFEGVKAGALSSIDGIPHDTSGCFPLKVDFSDTVDIGKSYQWDFGDGSPIYNGTTAEVSHTYTTAGNFRARLVSTDPTRCITTDTSYVTIRVRKDKAIILASGAKLPPCLSLAYRFNNNSVPSTGTVFTDTSFVWDFGDNSPLVKMGKLGVDHTYPAAGTYKVKLILNDTTFCNAFDVYQFNISISPLVKANFSTPGVGCKPHLAEFSNTSVAGQTFIWDFGDGSAKYTGSNPPAHLYSQLGDYTVTLIAIDPATCNGADTLKYNISVKPKPVASFSVSPDPAQENTPTKFTNVSSGAKTYEWNFGDDDTSSAITPTHLYQKTGSFNACLVAISEFGCTDTTCHPVGAIISDVVDVPNAFTPNGDGINDKVYVRGFGIAQMNFRVYNRWGQLMFESASPYYGWDGKFKGELQPMDVYAYTLIVAFGDGSTVTKKGDITLIR